MSDTEEPEREAEPETEQKKPSIFDYITKKHVDNFLESLFIIIVALVIFFFYPLIRYYVVEGVTLAKCYYNPPVGHKEPLGGHAAPEALPVKRTRHWPTPIQFFDDYVIQSKPLIMQGLAKEFPAFLLWSDEYVRTKASSENVSVRTSEGLYTSKTVASFLDVYQGERLHLHTTIPKTLSGDLTLPPQISCGNFPSALAEVVLWVNGGNVTVGLNTEVLDGLHCSLKGQLSIVLINKLYHEFAKVGVTMSLDRRKLDLCMLRDLRRLPWYNVTLDEGDCLYIPSGWFKEVSFTIGRNFGVSFRSVRLLYFNQSECETRSTKSLPDIQSEDLLLKYEIISLSENHAALDFFTFRSIYLMPDINDLESLKKLFSLLDQDGDGEVLIEDMYTMQTDHFLSFFRGYKSRDTVRGREVAATVDRHKQSEDKEL